MKHRLLSLVSLALVALLAGLAAAQPAAVESKPSTQPEKAPSTPQGAPVAQPSGAGLVPDRLYYGVGRAIPMTVVGEGDKPLKIELWSPLGKEPVASADVKAGSVNLATLFPIVWTAPRPELMYAQLVVGGEREGAPVVIQPLLEQSIVTADQQGQLKYSQSRLTYSGVRAYVDRHVVFETSMGSLEIRLRPDVAPNTVWNFRSLVAGGFYTDLIFHRIIDARPGRAPFMIQGGDPTGTGAGGPGYMVDMEASVLPHDFGVFSMARTPDPNSAGSQFFICLSRAGTSFLDRNYCSFAQTVRGAETILKMGAVEVESGGEGSRPKDPPKLVRAYLIDAPPWGKAPAPVKRPEAAATPR